MAMTVGTKPLYVVFAVNDLKDTVAYSAHFNRNDADKAAEESGGQVLTTDLHINYTRA